MGERINWTLGTPRHAIENYVKWRDAIEKADTGDLGLLIALLQSDLECGPDSRGLLADLLSRHRLAKKKGGQKKAAYRVTTREGSFRQAEKLVAYFRNKGMTVESAIKAALRDQKREYLEMKGNDEAAFLSDDALDEMMTDEEFDLLENRIRRGRKSK